MDALTSVLDFFKHGSCSNCKANVFTPKIWFFHRKRDEIDCPVRVSTQNHSCLSQLSYSLLNCPILISVQQGVDLLLFYFNLPTAVTVSVPVVRVWCGGRVVTNVQKIWKGKRRMDLRLPCIDQSASTFFQSLLTWKVAFLHANARILSLRDSIEFGLTLLFYFLNGVQ